MLLFDRTPSWRCVLLTVCCAAVIGFGGRRTLPIPHQTLLRRRARRLMLTQSSLARALRHPRPEGQFRSPMKSPTYVRWLAQPKLDTQVRGQKEHTLQFRKPEESYVHGGGQG
jgi:hypothetical protein